ncbi:MAG: hypothetical protein KGO47_07250 [Cyanobacteria bacterium REEB417]|nr:hypothetical protein [Cyanobacteria bacterium REEB417]
MSDNAHAFPGQADQEPFDASEDLEDEGISPAVAQVMDAAAQADLSTDEMLELALCAIGEVAADLTAGIDDETGPDPMTVAALERLQVAAEVLAGIAFGGDDEDGGDEAEAA